MIVQSAPLLAWCHSVTIQEYRNASDTINTFINGAGAATSIETEMFARALAIRVVMDDPRSILDTIRRANNLMPSVVLSVGLEEEVRKARAWLPRGNSINNGLTKSVLLLGNHEAATQSMAAVESFKLSLHLLLKPSKPRRTSLFKV